LLKEEEIEKLQVKLKVLLDKESIYNASITQMKNIQLQMKTYQKQVDELTFRLAESQKANYELSDSYNRLYQEYTQMINLQINQQQLRSQQPEGLNKEKEVLSFLVHPSIMLAQYHCNLCQRVV